ncbi:ATP-binding protein DrrA1-3 family domain-containing protein [Pseudarthrobacter sp. CCNWLW247]|uniref:ATP-binding protein DrrA1-3 family domain-containing protein n=1 Tax=unclassified Pseudarthrobacter TaxID=2647000 RepID=UPI003FCF46E5
MAYFGRLKGMERHAAKTWSLKYLEKVALADKANVQLDKQKTKGATVVMVTHQMEEVERLCDRVILLKNGTAEAYGTIDEVQNQYGGRVIGLRHAGPIPASPNYTVTANGTNYSELSITDATDEADILKELIAAGVAVRSFITTKVSLEEIFIRAYGDQNKADAATFEPAGA